MNGSGRDEENRTAKKQGRKRSRHGRRPSTTALAIIDGLLQRKVRVVRNSKEQDMTAFEAIIHQLIQKENAGDAHASRVLLKYEQLARQEVRPSQHIFFADDPYSRRLATPEPSDG